MKTGTNYQITEKSNLETTKTLNKYALLHIFFIVYIQIKKFYALKN